MLYYASIAGVSDEDLAFLGYVLIFEDEATKIYRHFGDDVVVDKDDPFMWVEDVNDAVIIRGHGEIISLPGKRS